MDKITFIITAILILFIVSVVIILKSKKIKLVIGILQEQNVINIGGILYELDISSYIAKEAYIKYYDGVKLMTVIGYLPDIGYVLSPTDRDICKFYLLSEIYIARIGDNIEGYIKDDKFYAISTVD